MNKNISLKHKNYITKNHSYKNFNNKEKYFEKC